MTSAHRAIFGTRRGLSAWSAPMLPLAEQTSGYLPPTPPASVRRASRPHRRGLTYLLLTSTLSGLERVATQRSDWGRRAASVHSSIGVIRSGQNKCTRQVTFLTNLGLDPPHASQRWAIVARLSPPPAQPAIAPTVTRGPCSRFRRGMPHAAPSECHAAPHLVLRMDHSSPDLSSASGFLFSILS